MSTTTDTPVPDPDESHDQIADTRAARPGLHGRRPGARIDLGKADPDPAAPEGLSEPTGSSDSHVDVALDEEPTPGGVPVDTDPATANNTTAGATTAGATTGSGAVPAGPGRRPVVAPQWSNWANIVATLQRAAAVTAYRAAFHAVRLPWYSVQAVFWAIVGTYVVARTQIKWWWVAEASDLRQQAVAKGDGEHWLKLHRESVTTRAARGRVLVIEFLIGTAVVLAALWWAPWWLQAVGIAVAVVLLAAKGRPADRRIISPAVVTARFRRVNADIVLRAYYAAGLGHPEKPDQQVTFGSPMSRDERGTGSQVVIDLPWGKGFADAVKARDAIASGLDVSINQVFLTRDPSSNRRHLLFVSDRDPLAIPAGRTPLLDGKVRDIWTEAPLGIDERGRKVGLLLMWVSVLVGAQPRKGKTFFARLLALFAALDPYVVMLVVDGKMSPDWDKFKLIAHRYVCGVVPNSRDTDPITHLLEMLREIKAHIQEVNDLLSKLPTSECPEGKITRELSRKYPVLRVWMLVMEEFQTYFETDDQKLNIEIAGLLSFIIAVGPSAGVIILSSSQKPSGVGAGDVSRLFNRYRDNHAVRFALKCGNRNVSDAVLGGDAYAEGFDASALPGGNAYRGVGILYGASDDTSTVCTHLADHGDAEKILTAARRHREAAGTLSGYAVGEQSTREVRDVLADVASVFEANEPGLHWATIAERMAARMPQHYDGLAAEAASALLREHVPSVGVKVGGVNHNGCRRAHLDTAIAARKTA